MTWVAVGVTAVSAVTNIAGGMSASKKAKKREAELQAKIAAITAKVAESTRNRLKEVDKLTDAQIEFADEQMNNALEYYANLKLKYAALYERNAQAAEEQYGQQLKDIESNLQQELGIQAEVFAEYNQGIDSLYSEVRDLVQTDLAFNDGLKEEFRTTADEAIKNTFIATEGAKVDLQQLNDSGGRPENFDRVIAENAKAFGDIQTDIERSDAGRGRTDLTGKKLTAQFAEAMSKGNISGNMGAQGLQQKQSLRSEITGLGSAAINQNMAKLQGGEATSRTQMADLAAKFKGQKIDSLMQEGMNRLNMTQDANQKSMVATEMYNQAINELQAMLQSGQLSAEEATFAAEQLNAGLKQQAKEQNWAYKDRTARQHENQMLATVGQAGRELSTIDSSINWGQIGSQAVGTFAGMYGGGVSKPAAKPNDNGFTPPSSNPNTDYGQVQPKPATGGFWSNLFGSAPKNNMQPTQNGGYVGGNSQGPSLGRYNNFMGYQ